MVFTANYSWVSSVLSSPSSSDVYRFLLPPLPTGKFVLSTVFLHCDPGGLPYKIDDFDAPLREVVRVADMAGLGAFKYNHVLMLTLHNSLSKEQLVKVKELSIKGKKYIVIDPNRQELSLKVRWIPYHVPDEAVKKLFEPFGQVNSVSREKWRRSGFEEIETSTRAVTLILKEGVTSDANYRIKLPSLALMSWFLCLAVLR